jgi:hypothetical protein
LDQTRHSSLLLRDKRGNIREIDRPRRRPPFSRCDDTTGTVDGFTRHGHDGTKGYPLIIAASGGLFALIPPAVIFTALAHSPALSGRAGLGVAGRYG